MSDQQKPKLGNLELNKQTVQELTSEEAEEAQGGVGLPLHAPPRLPQKQPPQKQ